MPIIAKAHPGWTKAPNSLLRSTDTTAEEKGLLLIIASFGDPDGTRCNPSVTSLCELSGHEKRWIMRTLKGLEERGWLTVTRRPGKQSLYRVQPVSQKATGTSVPKGTTTKSINQEGQKRKPWTHRDTGLKARRKGLMLGI